MKIWIDKHGGMHYHKADCKATKVPPFQNNYEEIEHPIRRHNLIYDRTYAPITIEDRTYLPCPFCFGHDDRR